MAPSTRADTSGEEAAAATAADKKAAEAALKAADAAAKAATAAADKNTTDTARKTKNACSECDCNAGTKGEKRTQPSCLRV
jgi:hypothetical protein